MMSAKKPRTKTKPRRPLPRKMWDFSKISPNEAASICRSEYAKEADKLLASLSDEEWMDILRCAMNRKADAERLDLSFAKTMRNRVSWVLTQTEKQQEAEEPVIKEVRLDSASSDCPVGCYNVCLQINWTASNKKLTNSFISFLQGHLRAEATPQAEEAYTALAASTIKLPRKKWGKDSGVEKSAELWGKYVIHTAGVLPGGLTNGHVVNAIRRVGGGKRGRGDSVRAQLDDLGIYRLIESGTSASAMRTMFKGKTLIHPQKFRSTRLANRSHRQVKRQLLQHLKAACVIAVLNQKTQT